jgi:3-oxoacyl-[acyl-carrier-protein] synthase II
MRRVVITGMGAVTAIGNSPEALFANALAARSAVRLAPELAAFATPPLVAAADLDAAAVTLKPRAVPMDRAAAMAVAAARQAVAAAGAQAIVASPRTGVYWGTGCGGAGTTEAAYARVYGEDNWKLRPTTVVMAMAHSAAALVSLDMGTTGPALTYSVACASSAIAIGEALRAIRHGIIDRAIVGGSDAMLTRGTLAAWTALGALATIDANDPGASCKPFALDRTGFVLGEGAGALLLEAADAAYARNAPVQAELAGYALTSDATHVTDPSVDGQVRALAAALDDAGVAPGDIGYINAHGTATAIGDRVEAASLHRAFGAGIMQVPVSATKALHGHAMGATGAIELIIAVMAMTSGSLPPTAHLRQPDPELELDLIPCVARHVQPPAAVLSTSFAFGGANAVLVARNVASPGTR